MCRRLYVQVKYNWQWRLCPTSQPYSSSVTAASRPQTNTSIMRARTRIGMPADARSKGHHSGGALCRGTTAYRKSRNINAEYGPVMRKCLASYVSGINPHPFPPGPCIIAHDNSRAPPAHMQTLPTQCAAAGPQPHTPQKSGPRCLRAINKQQRVQPRATPQVGWPRNWP